MVPDLRRIETVSYPFQQRCVVPSNSVRSVPMKSASESSARVLMIEPDTKRAVVLQNALRPRLDAELVIVNGIEEALRSIATQIPDLVLTSTFLAPEDEAALTAHLKQIPDAAHVQVVNAPYFLDVNGEAPDDSRRSKVMEFLGLRAATIRPRCDVETFQKQIEEYLDRAVSIRSERNVLQHALLVPTRTMSGSWLRPTPQSGATGLLVDESDLPSAESGHERRRARRLRGHDVPSLWTIRLPWGDTRIVNISTSGVLIESTSKIDPGTTMDLRLVGHGTDLIVPARTIRANVAQVDRLGVKYHLAIAFSREVILPKPTATPDVEDGPSPRALADLMTGILGDVEHASRAPQMCERFESDLRRLLRLRDVQIRETPQIPDDPSQSIYFTIPQTSTSGRPRILQVTFESGRAPSEMDFRLLKSAASAAALVLEFAPLRTRLLNGEQGPRGHLS